MNLPSFHFLLHIQNLTTNFVLICGYSLSAFSNSFFCLSGQNLRVLSIKSYACLIFFVKLHKLYFWLQHLIYWLFRSSNNFVICYFLLHVNHARRLFLYFLSFVTFPILKIEFKELFPLHTCWFQRWNLLFLFLNRSN